MSTFDPRTPGEDLIENKGEAPQALPPMSAREESWHAHVASTNAAPAAAEELAPAAKLAAASTGSKTVAGITFPPLSAGGLIAIQMASNLADNAGIPIIGADEIAILVYCLAESEDAFALADAGKLSEILRNARVLLAPVPLTQITTLSAWCSDAIAEATGQKKTDLSAPMAPVS